MNKLTVVIFFLLCNLQFAFAQSEAYFPGWNISGKYGVQTDNPEFSEIGCGNSLVAIIDTGVDYNNKELMNSVWVNPNETFDGFDNDGNGYVDDIHGINVGSYAQNPLPIDISGHGTHVAGIMFSQEFGIIPECKFIAINIFNNLLSASNRNLSTAIKYLIDIRNRNGLDYIFVNMSLGDVDSDQEAYDAIHSGIDNGLVFVGSSGNNAVSLDGKHKFYPANYDGVVSVASINYEGKLSSFSNWGKNVSIAAPGEYIQSYWLNNQKRILSGTSMAAPHVTGLLAKYYGITGEIGTQKLIDYSKFNNKLKNKTVKSSSANFPQMVYSIPMCQEKKFLQCNLTCNKYTKKNGKKRTCRSACRKKTNCQE